MIINIQAQKSTYFTHGFHPYPAKYTPQLVNKFFNLYCKPGFKILDPFCGSGTTMVEGILNGMESVGIDLNPIAYVISKAKTNEYSSEDIELLKEFVANIRLQLDTGFFVNARFKQENSPLVPDIPNRKHWFQENVSIELAHLKARIGKVENEKARDLLHCAFSKIIVRVSNQDSEVRYTAKNKNHQDAIVFTSFLETLDKYLLDLASYEYSITGKAAVHLGNSADILKKYPDDYFDFIITSPPYINTFDYYLYHKQRMFWLDYDHRPVRKKEIGNHHRIDTKTFDVAKQEYEKSMISILEELSRTSKQNSYFVMVIGDGIVEGKTIDMSSVVAEICEKCSYVIESVESVNLSDVTRSFNRKFSNAPKKEHTIILKNLK